MLSTLSHAVTPQEKQIAIKAITNYVEKLGFVPTQITTNNITAELPIWKHEDGFIVSAFGGAQEMQIFLPDLPQTFDTEEKLTLQWQNIPIMSYELYFKSTENPKSMTKVMGEIQKDMNIWRDGAWFTPEVYKEANRTIIRNRGKEALLLCVKQYIAGIGGNWDRGKFYWIDNCPKSPDAIVTDIEKLKSKGKAVGDRYRQQVKAANAAEPVKNGRNPAKQAQEQAQPANDKLDKILQAISGLGNQVNTLTETTQAQQAQIDALQTGGHAETVVQTEPERATTANGVQVMSNPYIVS